jgi:hypothetical protein
MYHLRNRFLRFAAGCFILNGFLSCAFADLRPVSVSTDPAEPETILNEVSTPVSVCFDTPMRQSEVERILSVDYYAGKAQGDLKWQDNNLFFYPVGGWTPGVRYTLSLNGNAFSEDGRDANFSNYVPFYAVKKEAAPFLTHFYPDDGESVGVLPEDGGKIKLFFSGPMDEKSVEDAFSIDGIGKMNFAWNGSRTELEICPDVPLDAWNIYRWSLGAKAISTEGIPIAKSYSAQFTANKDKVFPKVKYVCPALKSEKKDGDYEGGYYWRESTMSIENHLGTSQSIAIVFTKAMDKKSVENGLRFEPSLTGNIEQYSPTIFHFIPLRQPETETLYRLTISSETKDCYGLKLQDEYAINFVVDIPYLELTSLKQFDKGSATELSNIKNGMILPVNILSGVEECKLVFQFSLPVDDIESRANIAQSIRLEPFFPASLNGVVLRWANWIGLGNDILTLEWEGLAPGEESQPNYYKLTIPGSSSGISDGAGSYLKDTIIIYLEALH